DLASRLRARGRARRPRARPGRAGARAPAGVRRGEGHRRTSRCGRTSHRGGAGGGRELSARTHTRRIETSSLSRRLPIDALAAVGLPALYLAARPLTGSRRAALLGAGAFLLLPSLTYAFPPIRTDGSALSGTFIPPPWRLVALVEYGEGPHVLSLSFALLGVAATLRYLRAPSGLRLAVAIIALVAVAFTNLIGALGMAIFIFGIALANGPAASFTGKWRRLAKLGVLTVLFSLGWYSLGFMRAFSQPGGGDTAF